ncbi:hypothetical protein ACPPVO_17160 [Dactylosporangium sp. McL0621]|uniref:hypothetical protein n=1 Tax=Dactylosporangium sp. McL0621 TaxID=3415678 RepID=UPI003CF8C139
MRWGGARCPVRDVEQAWIERSLGWLTAQFGRAALFGDVFTPSDEYFPGVYTGSTGDVEAVVRRLCARMGVERGAIALEYDTDGLDPELAGHIPLLTDGRTAAGHYQVRDGRAVVTLRADLTARPMALVATVAHELGHVRLLGEGRADPDAGDHEPLTDLCALYFGLGIFGANAAFEFARRTQGRYTYTGTTRLGYLTEPMYGYALARYAWLRNEPDPAWAGFVDTNPRAVLKQGLRYLARPQ